MTESVRLGEPREIMEKKRNTRPLTSLPAKLTLEACLEIIERVDYEFTAKGIMAGRDKLDVDRIDLVLEYVDLSLDDKIRFKTALAQLGVISAGKRV
jgi:hypothetical protein